MSDDRLYDLGDRPYIDFVFDDPKDPAAFPSDVLVTVQDPALTEEQYTPTSHPGLFTHVALSKTWTFLMPEMFKMSGTWICTCQGTVGLIANVVTERRVRKSKFTKKTYEPDP
jgi:hypothetical protein